MPASALRPASLTARLGAGLALLAVLAGVAPVASARVISVNNDVGGSSSSNAWSGMPLPFLGSCAASLMTAVRPSDFRQGVDDCLGAVGTPEDAAWVRLLGARVSPTGQWVKLGTDTQVVDDVNRVSTTPWIDAGSFGRDRYVTGSCGILCVNTIPLSEASPDVQAAYVPMRTTGSVIVHLPRSSFILAMSGTWLRDTEGPEGLITDHWSSYYRFDDVEFAEWIGPGGVSYGPSPLGFGMVNRFMAQRLDQVSIYRFEAAPVPEPASALLLLGGVGLLAGVAARRRS